MLTPTERACIIASLNESEIDELLVFISTLKTQRQQETVDAVLIISGQSSDDASDLPGTRVFTSEFGRNQGDDGADISASRASQTGN